MKAIHYTLFVALIILGGVIESCNDMTSLMTWTAVLAVVAFGLYELRDVVGDGKQN